MDSSQGNSSSEKKGVLEGLDREELIRKCKGLLGIAQKAKKAKDELANEVTLLKEKLSECDKQKHADKEGLNTMKIMVETLTENKLEAANKIADLNKSVKTLTQQLSACNQKLEKLSELEIENEAKDKQIQRLTNENEEQEMDLKNLDEKLAKVSELSQRQTQELLVLEQSIDRWKAMESAYHKLQHDNKELQAKVEALQNSMNNETTSVSADRHEDIVCKLQKERDENRRLYDEAKEKLDELNAELEEIKTNRTGDDDEEKIDVLKEKLQHENEQLRKQSTEHTYKLEKYKSKVCEFSSKLKEVKQSKKLLSETLFEYSKSVSKWQVQITHASKLLVKEVNELNDNKTGLEKQVENHKSEIENLRKTVDELECQLEKSSQSNETTDERYQVLLADYQTLQQDIQDKNAELASLTEEWEKMCSDLKAENEKSALEIERLNEQCRETSKECQGKSQQIFDLEQKEIEGNKKNAELLAEMRELNDILKARGEVISSQAAEIDQIKVKLNEQLKQISSLEESLKEKTRQIELLRNQYDNQSEILSTSTISRADEVARMRDIEDSFEEKYNKLRALALKLKKKIAEQQTIITKLESSAVNTSTSVMSPAPETPSIPPAQAQNLISLQKDNDRLLDKIESMNSEQKQLKNEINQLNQKLKTAEDEAKSLKIVNEDIKTAADTNLKIKSALDEKIKAGEKQIEALKNDNKNTVQQLKNAENEIIKLNGVIKQKDEEISQKADEVQKIKTEMNKLKASMKKNNVLNLEVEAYEKSLTEMSQKYETTSKQLLEAKTEIETNQNAIKILTTEIQTLTNQLELEKQNSSEYQQQTELQRIKIKENGSEIAELNRKIDDHVKESNQIKIELANLQSQQSENEVERQRFISKLKTENESNVTKILSLEEEVRDLRLKLSSCEQELANVQTDFASYKIRAQSVLRQNQSKDSSNEEELKEELAILTKTKDDLTAKVAHSTEQQRRLENTIEELKGEKANLQERCKKLLGLLDESRQQIEQLQNENRKQSQEHQEALKMQRLQVDTLNNCFKTQIAEMQKKYEDEIAVLKTTTPTRSADISDGNLSLARGAQLTTEQRIELLMMERQDGEGSECTSSINPRKISSTTRDKHEVIPLDELLNNSIEEELETNDNEPGDDRFIPKEKFEAQQSRVKHLSTLLSEAELDVARLTEMNSMLKEELRRQERSTEREKQMQNLEYMKNVIFKFLTINNADERAHLVPVLNIILKLSPDENKTLQSVARGGDGSQSGWSNLLPMW